MAEKTFEIYWNDLTEEAKKRLAPLHNENDEQVPLAIIELETDEEAMIEDYKKYCAERNRQVYDAAMLFEFSASRELTDDQKDFLVDWANGQ